MREDQCEWAPSIQSPRLELTECSWGGYGLVHWPSSLRHCSIAKVPVTHVDRVLVAAMRGGTVCSTLCNARVQHLVHKLGCMQLALAPSLGEGRLHRRLSERSEAESTVGAQARSIIARLAVNRIRFQWWFAFLR